MSTLKTALDLIPEKIRGLLKDYREDFEQAWLKKEDDGDLSVSFSATFSVKHGANACEVGMSFIKEKIKDKTNFTWDDKQPTLPLKKNAE